MTSSADLLQRPRASEGGEFSTERAERVTLFATAAQEPRVRASLSGLANDESSVAPTCSSRSNDLSAVPRPSRASTSARTARLFDEDGQCSRSPVEHGLWTEQRAWRNDIVDDYWR